MAPKTTRDLSDQIDRPALRYVMIGAGSALAYNLVLIAVHAAGAHYLLAALTAFVVVVLGAYCAHAAFTFQVACSVPGLLRFAGTQIIGFPVSAALLAGLVDGAGLPVWLATPVVTVVMLVYNFVSARWAMVRGQPRTRI
jgi:putative flippase GtrA